MKPVSTFESLGNFLKQAGIGGVPGVAVGGFHNGGLNFVKSAKKAGYRIVAVSDRTSGIVDLRGNGGLKITELAGFRKNGKEFMDLDRAKVRRTGPEFLMKMEVDVLIPEGIEGILNESNADDVRAKMILEVKKGQITKEALEILREKQILIIPLHS